MAKPGKPSDALNPWIPGPIYLAGGGTRKPLGWGEVEIIVQKAPLNLPVAVLAPQMLAFQTVLGLDYLSLSGLQIDVQNQAYWFQLDAMFSYQRDVIDIYDLGPRSLFTAVDPL